MLVLGKLDDGESQLLGVAVEAAVAAGNLRVREIRDVAGQPRIPRLPVVPGEAETLVQMSLRDIQPCRLESQWSAQAPAVETPRGSTRYVSAIRRAGAYRALAES